MPAPPPHAPPRRAVLSSQNTIAAYAHLTRHFGEPVAVQRLTYPAGGRERRLDVAQFSPLGKGSSALLATCGAADLDLGDHTQVELFMLVRPVPDEDGMRQVAQLLISLLAVSKASGNPLLPGSQLRLPPELQAFGHFPVCLVLPPVTLVRSFSVLRHKSGLRIPWLWVVPVFESESTLASTVGVGELYTRWARAEVDLANLQRSETALPA